LDLFSIAIAFGIVLASLTVHEAAHAWTADRLGDPTARMLGRVSLNPIVHIDLIGTVVLPIVAVLSGLPLIGWAKPVPVNISQLREPRRDFMIVAAAGPLSNIAQAILYAIILRLVLTGPDTGLFDNVLVLAVRINLLLAFFNLIPIPPLDGGNVLAGLLPPSAAGIFVAMRQYGFIALYALMLSGILFRIIWPPTLFVEGLLIP
jgi:Zn-dependent protease